MRDEEIYLPGTVVRLKKTGEFAIVRQVFFLRPELRYGFLHYLAEIEGRRPGQYAIYHQDVELEVAPL